MQRTKYDRCQMYGRHAHDGWKHVTRSGHIKSSYRCEGEVAYVTRPGQRLCAECVKFARLQARAEIRIAQAVLSTLRHVKKVKKGKTVAT